MIIYMPTVFNFYISDLNDFFSNKNIYGVSINHRTDVIDHEYADDIIILATSPVDMQKNLIYLKNTVKQKNYQLIKTNLK